MTRPNLNIDTKQVRNFSVEHYRHRYFNEIPSINRQIAEIHRNNNDVTRLLKNKEEFTSSTPEEEHATFIFNRRCGNPRRTTGHKEHFTVKKHVSFGDIIDSILSFILIIVFIIFIGKLAYICFFEREVDNEVYV